MKIQSELVKYLLIIKHEKEVERLSRHNDLWSVPFVGESNRLIGFVYEADQNKIKEAQDRVDELRHQETLDKIDEAIDAIAVSYTHLRAHETGRNLVCRLLLEKKKT